MKIERFPLFELECTYSGEEISFTKLLRQLQDVGNVTTFEQTYIVPNVWGRWVESAIGSYLLNKADELDFRLYYWRENNDEVDFVIEKTNNGLSVLTNKFQPKHSFVVGSGGIPVEDFLTLDIENLFEL